MERSITGKIKVVPGDKGGRFPFCNTLYIDDEIKVIVDPGAGPDILLEIKNRSGVDLVLNTHCHFDHIAYNYIFNDAKIYLNENEGICFQNREEIPRRIGMIEVYGEDYTREWLERISKKDSPQSPYSPQNRHEWWLSTARLDGTFRWGEVFDLGKTKMEIIGSPGHSAGFSCLYFPDWGVVYTGDIDLTGFGPFYGCTDSDIDLFIDSARKVARLDADIFITGHEVGVVTRREFLSLLEKYLEIIGEREQKILAALAVPLSLKEITGQGLIYGSPKFLVDQWVWVWEEMMVKHHLKRMLDRGVISFDEGKYVRV
ncbi:MAG: MBL fold metallo-hydrolase [Bacillota bacterium]